MASLLTGEAASGTTAGPPKVLCLGLLRTGTLSLCAALEELGYESYHGIKELNNQENWLFLDRAAEATWSSILMPDAASSPPPFRRADWDVYFGRFDALLDLASFFAPQLIAAYPDAKVILTTRDYDRWAPSFDSQVMSGLLSPVFGRFIRVLGVIVGNSSARACRKILIGYFGGARTREDVLAVMEQAYCSHYETVRALVPKDRLLEYRVGRDGWEPLCEFLDKEVPDRGFPFVNEGKAHNEFVRRTVRENVLKGLIVLARYAVPVAFAVVVWRVGAGAEGRLWGVLSWGGSVSR